MSNQLYAPAVCSMGIEPSRISKRIALYFTISIPEKVNHTTLQVWALVSELLEHLRILRPSVCGERA